MPRFVLLVLATLALLVRPARAQETKTIVALLPLDAEARLAIYGQPVAAEIAKVLTGTEITLIVVGARMAVPAEAELIVDGKVEHDKGTNKVALALRIRQMSDGATVGDDVVASAIGLPNIDKAAADASQKLLVELRKLHLARTTPVPADLPPPTLPSPQVTPPAGKATLVAVFATDPAHTSFRAHLSTALEASLKRAGRVGEDFVKSANHGWSGGRAGSPETEQRIHALTLARTPKSVDIVKASGRELAVVLDVRGLETTAGLVPLARARVRVRVIDPKRVVFDRVIVTDSIVGDRGMTADDLATRTAREVIAILGPHLRRQVPAW